MSKPKLGKRSLDQFQGVALQLERCRGLPLFERLQAALAVILPVGTRKLEVHQIPVKVPASSGLLAIDSAELSVFWRHIPDSHQSATLEGRFVFVAVISGRNGE